MGEPESGLSRRSGSGWIATVSKTCFDAPIPRASNAFILAWRVEGGITDDVRCSDDVGLRHPVVPVLIETVSQSMSTDTASELFAVAGRYSSSY